MPARSWSPATSPEKGWPSASATATTLRSRTPPRPRTASRSNTTRSRWSQRDRGRRLLLGGRRREDGGHLEPGRRNVLLDDVPQEPTVDAEVSVRDHIPKASHLAPWDVLVSATQIGG